MGLRTIKAPVVATTAALVAALGAAVPLATPAGATSTTVPVAAATPWTDTGVALGAGQSFSVGATGKAGWLAGRSAGPKGMPFDKGICAGEQYTNEVTEPFIAPGLSCYSLIGRIGSSGVIFEVGAHFTLTSPVSGELYLGMNDNFYSDNSGSWTATVTS